VICFRPSEGEILTNEAKWGEITQPHG
jgi:hypothetical protein